MIKETTADEKEQLISIIEQSGQFDADGLKHVSQTMDEHFANPGHALWYTAHTDRPVGVAYCTPEPLTLGTWNLLMLWVEKGQESKGFGSALVEKIEHELIKKDVRLLIVETSGMEAFEAARAFYKKSGFTLEATVKNFFDAGDDKLIYTKQLKNS